ncbi:MAG: anaerobic ribonucleoside-triphosphate reductase activating protein [Coprobacillus sp.]|nr:anaerobic ribonucleoside-triphosphate reductase activating protein [Coprobacillus sp.]
MNIVSMEKMSLVDYPNKISTVLFMKGCNFCCPFCHNKDLVLHGDTIPVMDEDEIFTYLKRRQGMIDAVVITGGEPTLDPDLIDLIKRIKDMGYLVKLDTNGSNSLVLKEIVSNKLVDYIAMDIKNCPARYDETAGAKVDLEEIKASIRILLKGSVNFEFRMTIMKEFHQPNAEDVKELAHLIDGAKLLMLQKYEDSPNCIVGGFHALNEREVREYRKALSVYFHGAIYCRGYGFS